ncbi:MAG TPA: phenylalanine--tRNA ligase subunit alpha, partial [Bacillota bacterium]|nr:phenylalanine--tRNA ligase subunit alpha [Bacillota bacterium]
MKDQLNHIEQEAIEKIEEAETLKDVQDLQVAYLGRKGSITTVLRGMGKLPAEERPVIGELANKIREKITNTLQNKKTVIEDKALEAQLAQEHIDVTLPGRKVSVGGPHLLTSIIEEIEDLFIGLGYEVKEGPEVEEDYYNFEALNLPKGHPARDMQ